MNFFHPKQELKHVIYLVADNLYSYAMSNILRTIGFKWIDAKGFKLNKYSSNISKPYVIEIDLKCSKELIKLCNACHLAQGKIVIKKQML